MPETFSFADAAPKTFGFNEAFAPGSHEGLSLPQRAALTAEPYLKPILKAATIPAGIAETVTPWYAQMGSELGAIGRGVYEAMSKRGDGRSFTENFKKGFEEVMKPYEQHVAPHLTPESWAGKKANEVLAYPQEAIRWAGERIVDAAMKVPGGDRIAPYLGALWEGWAQLEGLTKAADATIGKVPGIGAHLARDLGRRAAKVTEAANKGADDLAAQLDSHFSAEAQPAHTEPPQPEFAQGAPMPSEALFTTNPYDVGGHVSASQRGELHTVGGEGDLFGGPDLEAANRVATAPDVESAIKAAVGATSKPIKVLTPAQVREAFEQRRRERGYAKMEDLRHQRLAELDAQIRAEEEADRRRTAQGWLRSVVPNEGSTAMAVAMRRAAGLPEFPERGAREAQGRNLMRPMESLQRGSKTASAPEFKLPERMTRAALKKVIPQIGKLSDEQRGQVAHWLNENLAAHERKGAEIARHCLGQ